MRLPNYWETVLCNNPRQHLMYHVAISRLKYHVWNRIITSFDVVLIRKGLCEISFSWINQWSWLCIIYELNEDIIIIKIHWFDIILLFCIMIKHKKCFVKTILWNFLNFLIHIINYVSDIFGWDVIWYIFNHMFVD